MFLIIIISIVLQTITAAPTNRQAGRSIQLYSKTGQLMNIRSSGRVSPSRGKAHVTAVIDLLPVGQNQFKLREVKTGLFVKIDKQLRLRTVLFASEATIFSEEVLARNNFVSFHLAERDDCRITVSKRSYRVVCGRVVKDQKISFLPRKTHLPKYYGALI